MKVISFVNQKWPATPLSGAREEAAGRRHWKSESVDALQEKMFSVQVTRCRSFLQNPQKMGCSSWKICLPIFQDRWTKRLLNKKCQLLVFLAGPTRPCQISASLPSCKASRPFLKAAAATQRGMERKTCRSVSNNDKLCGQRQASAPEVWWCPIQSEDFFIIEGYTVVDGLFL